MTGGLQMGWFANATSLLGIRRADGGENHQRWWYDQSGSGHNANSGADEWYGPPPPKFGKATAEGVTAVYRCCCILAEVLTLPCSVYRLRTPGLPEDGMDPEPTHPLHDLVSLQPNRMQSAIEFWKFMGFTLALHGVAYAEIKRGPRGAVDRLIPLLPGTVYPEQISADEIRYKVADRRTGLQRTLLQEEVFRIVGLTMNGFQAVSPTSVGARAIQLAQELDEYAHATFSRNMNIGGFLIHPGKLSNDGRRRLAESIIERYTGVGNWFRPMVLAEGIKYEKAQMTAREAQMVEERKWQISEISRLYGVPLHLLGVDDQTNRSTTEEQSLNFLRFTARPWVANIEMAMQTQLVIAPKLYVIRFNMDDLDRGNMGTRADFWAKALGSGGSPAWLTPNEVRAEEGWNPLDDPNANKLAVGKNPETPTGNAPAATAAIADDTPKQEPVAALPAPPVAEPQKPRRKSPAEAFVRKEIATLRRLNVRHASDREDFDKAVRAFYGGLTLEATKKLKIEQDTAVMWLSTRASHIMEAEDVTAAINSFESELEEKLKGLESDNG